MNINISFLITMVIILVIGAVFFWCVSIIPNLPPIIKTIAYIIIALFCLGAFLNGVGFVHLTGIHIGK